MQKRKKTFYKRWDNTGTCYNQGVYITMTELDFINNKIDKTLLFIEKKSFSALTLLNNEDYKIKLYLKKLNIIDKKFIFTNLTQRGFIFEKLGIDAMLDRNTYFIIK